jgi:hypothetical protein
MRLWIVALLGFAVLGVPDVSHACSVCFSATDENRVAFLVTTILLTALPLVMIGSTIFWLWRRALRLNEAAARQPVPARRLAQRRAPRPATRPTAPEPVRSRLA